MKLFTVMLSKGDQISDFHILCETEQEARDEASAFAPDWTIDRVVTTSKDYEG